MVSNQTLIPFTRSNKCEYITYSNLFICLVFYGINCCYFTSLLYILKMPFLLLRHFARHSDEWKYFYTDTEQIVAEKKKNLVNNVS